MGNIAYNSFYKNVSDDDFTCFLKQICQERFGELITVKRGYYQNKPVSWIIGPIEEVIGIASWPYEWEIYRASKRKFGGKHPTSTWGSWLMYVIQNELSVRYGGKISDEGVEGTWKGSPDKYPTFRSWMYTRYKHIIDLKGEKFVEQIIFAEVPEKLKNL